MISSAVAVGTVLMLVLSWQGVAPGAPGFSRISAGEDPAAARLLDHATGTAAPDGAAANVAADHPQFTQAIRVSSTTSGSENKWSTQLRRTTKEPIAKGDLLVVAMTLRSIDGPGRAIVAFGTARPPHRNALARHVDVGRQWQEFQFPLLAPQDYAAGEAKISIGFGAAVQKIDVAQIEVFNFKGRRRVWDLVNSSSYRGVEPDAAWRKAACERIEKIRKADIRVEVVDADGKPVPQAAVNLRMTAHAFRFGSSFNPQVYQFEKSHPDLVRAYEKRFLDYFNVATPEAVMSWKSWENPEARACLTRAMDFLAAHRIPVIGHPLVWQAPRTLPESLHALIRQKDYSAYLARWNAHLAEKVEAMRGKFCEHLVINEFVDTDFLPGAMTDEAIVGWYRLVRQHDPAARLGILEHKMICNGAVEADKTLPWYESKIEMLMKNKVPLELIAFQGHFRDHLTEPERLLEIFDRFARYKLPLQVTEFDVEMDDELLQAEYLRDFFIACFSHPAVELIQQWGFWQKSHWRPKAALFRDDWSAKPNGRQFLDLVFKQWMTREAGATDADGRFTVRGFLGDYEVTAQKDGRVARARFCLSKGGHAVRLVLEPGAAPDSIRLGDRTEAVAVAVAQGATPREQLAAQELVDYFLRISGKRLERQEIAGSRVPTGVIAVGQLAKDSGLVSQEELDAVGCDGYVLKVAEGRGAVCGGRDLGTLYGAYGLLGQLGVKFYAKDCEIVPAIPSLVLPEGTTKVRPRYDLLGFYDLPRFCGLEPSVKLGHTPHDDHGNIQGPKHNDPAGHTSDFLVPYPKYGKDHPEYFALMKDGQRLHPVPGKRFDVHLCLSNPEVRRISTERVLKLIESQKERRLFIVTQGDGYDWCQCNACKALDAVPGDDMTDRLLDYVNHIARQVARKYPDKLLMTAAYTDATARPPTRVLPEPNVRVAYCPYPSRCGCQSHDLTCEKNRQSLDDIRGWLERCPRQLYIFEYPRGYKCWYEPFASFYAMTRRMRYYASTTIGGVGFCVAPENFRDLFLFVMGRLRWEPQADVEQLVDEFMAAYYGKAAPSVREYFDFFRREIDERPVHQKCEAPNPAIVTRRFADVSLEMFARAQAAVADDPVRLARVDAEKFCVLWADVHQRNAVNGRIVDRVEFARRLGELVRIARDRKIERVGRTDLGLTPNWLSSVTGVKLTSQPWHRDPRVEQLISGRP